jgi:sigma-B regulation protein RsbU (phosphoserine phosphatase)
LTVREGGDLAEEIARVNNLLAVNNEETMFATAFCAVVDVKTGEVVYSNCGHNAPLLIHRDGTMTKLLPTAPPLAAANDVVFRTSIRSIVPGDRLILFSDGLPEATNHSGEFFGDEKIEQVIRESADRTAQGLVRTIFNHVTEFKGGAPRYDDIACVALVYHGPIGTTPLLER